MIDFAKREQFLVFFLRNAIEFNSHEQNGER